MTLAAVAGTLALSAALPAAASAVNLNKAYDNGVLSYTKADDVVHTVFQDGTNDTVVSTIADPLGVKGELGDWSADGNRLLYTDADGDIRDLNPWTGQQIREVDEPSAARHPSLSPDGYQYLYGTTTTGSRMVMAGESSRLVIDGMSASSDSTSWSNEDTAIVVVDGEGIYRIQNASDYPNNRGAYGKSDNWVVGNGTFPLNATISRDGTKVAYSDLGPNGDQSQYSVVLVDADGQTPQVAVANDLPAGNETNPAISPDGKKIAFVHQADGASTQQLYIYDIAAEVSTPVPGTQTTTGANYQTLSWQPAEKPSFMEVEPYGSTDLGGTLGPDPFEGSATAPVTKTYKWQRCDDVAYPATNCADIPGATDPSYTTTNADLGKRVRYIRTWTNGAGTTTEATLVSDPVVEADVTKPLAPTITGKPAATSNDTEPAFTWTGAEGGGTYQCSLDNAAFTSCTSGDTVTITTEGPHSFRVRQIDAANNLGDPAEYTWDVDVTPPSNPNVTKKPSAITKSTTATIEFDGLDAGAKFECRVGKYDWEECTSPVELTGLSEGDQSYAIRQIDAAGNTSDTPALVEWTVDQTAPLAPTFGTNDPAVYTLSHARTFIGEAGGTYECQLDDGEWKACTSPVTLEDYVSGPHTFRVRQTDDAGNVGPAGEDSFTAYVDGPAKPVIVTKPAANAKDDTATFTWNAGNDVVAFECRLDGGSWAECFIPDVTYPGLDDGPHTFEIRGINASNIPGAIATYEWTVDTVKPLKPLVMKKPAAETTSTGFGDFMVAGEEGATRECSLDDAKWTDCGTVMARNDLPLGPHELGIRLKDEAGNVSDFVVITWTIIAPKIETPEPVQTVTTPAPPAAPAPVAETPAAPRATTPAPKAETAAPAKPKLTAIVGETGARGGSGTSTAANIVVKNDGVGVGCSITGTVLTSCKVDLYVDRATGARAVAASRVLVGTGTVREAEGTKKMQVDVELNATGRALMRKSPNGLKVKVDITGVPVKGAALKATGVATLVRQRTSAVVGGFAVDSAKLTTSARRQLTKLAKQVKGTAVAVRVVGHTDGSSEDNSYLKELGKRRAATVAKFLQARGVKAKVTLVSRGDTVPRATNATKAGRAKNRRVELRIDR